MSDTRDLNGTGFHQRYGIGLNLRSAGRLEIMLRCLVRLLRAIYGEARLRTGIPWSRRFRAWRIGLLPRSAALYGVDGSVGTLYVPDFAYSWRCYAMNGFLNPIIGNKLIVSQILAAHGIPHPHVFGVVSGGLPRSLGKNQSNAGMDLLLHWTADTRPVVFRPHWSGGGEGVFFLRRENEKWFINGKNAPVEDVRKLIGGLDRYIATAFVDQAAYSRKIYPDTSNTVRVLALSDKEGPFLASVVHRFGNSRSFPIDNFHQGTGGICAFVDVATQRLGRTVSLDKNNRQEWHSAHPETGVPIEGVAIPGLSQALEGVLTAMHCFPEATCVGWDLLMTDSGFCILEANAPPGLAVSQAHTPLLSDARTARFFAGHGLHCSAGEGL
jgi:hypothetical protein